MSPYPFPAHATSAELATFLGTAAPEGADRMLARATALIDALPLDTYVVTTGNVPVDAGVKAALRDATCAVVEAWVNAGGDAMALNAGSFSLGELSVTGPGSSLRPPPPLPSRALAPLFAAGLLPAQVSTW